MAFWNKLAFWKKDTLGLDRDLAMQPNIGMDNMGHQENFGMDNMGAQNNLGFDNQFAQNNPGTNEWGTAPSNYPDPRQKNDLGLPDISAYPGMGEPDQHMQMQQTLQSKQPEPFNPNAPIQEVSGNRDFELINAKLDSIKAQIDTINSRLAHIERIAGEDDKYHW